MTPCSYVSFQTFSLPDGNWIKETGNLFDQHCRHYLITLIAYNCCGLLFLYPRKTFPKAPREIGLTMQKSKIEGGLASNAVGCV